MGVVDFFSAMPIRITQICSKYLLDLWQEIASYIKKDPTLHMQDLVLTLLFLFAYYRMAVAAVPLRS